MNRVAMRVIGIAGIMLVIVVFGFGLLQREGYIYNRTEAIPVISTEVKNGATVSAQQPPQVATTSATVTPSPTPGIVLPPIAPNERSAHVPILLYHYISENPNKDDKARDGLSTPPSVFKIQLQEIKRAGYTTITFDELAAFFDGKSSLPAKPIILTFDDGYSDFYLNAFPILVGEGMKGVVFIPTGLMGGGSYMTWTQVEEIARSPYVFIAAHSIHHYMLTKSNDTVLTNELIESKRVLEHHVGYPVNWMAYPYGSFDQRVVAAVKDAGYVGAATTMPGTGQYKSRFFYMPRLRAGRRIGESLLRYIE